MLFNEAAQGNTEKRDLEDKMRHTLNDSPVVPLIGIGETDLFEETIVALIELSAGKLEVPAIEVLLRDEASVDAGLAKLAELKEKYGAQINILAGSIVKPEDVKKVADAGLDGLVSGGYSAKVAQAALDHELPYLPGFMTLSEVKTAHEEYGLNLIKLFPAKNPDAKAIKAPLARTGLVFHAPGDDNIPEGLTTCTTATEALAAWESGATEVLLDPAQSEWNAILAYMSENGVVACCTGGVKSNNLADFSHPSIIGVGASFIVGDAKKSDEGFGDAVQHIQHTANDNWKQANSPDSTLEETNEL